MRQISTTLIFITMLALAQAEPRVRPTVWAQPIINAPLENLHIVTDKIYRSEQPNEEAFAELHAYGIKEVLNLRHFHSDKDEAKGLDLKLHRIKMHAGNVTAQEIEQALSVIYEAKGPILVHCWHGADRTGAVIAAYRTVFQNWTKEQALDEMKNGGFGYHAKIYPNLETLINKLDVKALKAKFSLKPQSK